MSQLTLMSLLQQQQSSALTGDLTPVSMSSMTPCVSRQPPAWPQPPLRVCDPRGSARARHDLTDLGQSRPPDLCDPRAGGEPWSVQHRGARDQPGPRAQPPQRRGEQPGRGPGSQSTTGGCQQQQLLGLPRNNRWVASDA